MPQISELVTKVTAETSQFNRAMVQAESKVSSFSKIGVAGGVAIAAAFTAVIATAASMYNKLNDIADKYSTIYDNAIKIGISAQKFQELAHAADEAGVSSESLQKSLAKMNLTLGQAQSGNDKAREAFTGLGLSITELSRMSPDERYLKIAAAVKSLGTETQQAAALVRIFGKAGSEQIGLINSSISESISKYKELGITLNDTQIAQLDSFAEKKKVLSDTFGSFFEKAAAESAPYFEQLVERLQESIKEYGGMDKAAKDFAETAVSGIESTVTAMKALISVAGGVKGAFKEVGGGVYGFFNEADMLIQNGAQSLANKMGLRTAGQKALDAQGTPAPSVFGRTSLAAGASGTQVPMESSIPSLNKEDFVGTTFDTSLNNATKAAVKFAKAVDKTADDMLTNALKSGQGTSDQISRIVNGTDRKPIAVDADFDALASELVDFSQNNDGSAQNKRYQSNALLQLQGKADFASRMGEDSSAMREAIKQLTAYVQKMQGQNDVQKLNVTITPTKYAHIEWALSKENNIIMEDIINNKMAIEARGSAR